MEVKRGQDFNNPGSQDQDPIFSNYSLPKHEARMSRLLLFPPACQAPLRHAASWVTLLRPSDEQEVFVRRSATRAASSRRSSRATWRS